LALLLNDTESNDYSKSIKDILIKIEKDFCDFEDFEKKQKDYSSENAKKIELCSRFLSNQTIIGNSVVLKDMIKKEFKVHQFYDDYKENIKELDNMELTDIKNYDFRFLNSLTPKKKITEIFDSSNNEKIYHFIYLLLPNLYYFLIKLHSIQFFEFKKNKYETMFLRFLKFFDIFNKFKDYEIIKIQKIYNEL
jgi:hypothetical protein